MRKLIKRILREDEWDFVRDTEAKLVKGAHLCVNDKENYSGTILLVTKIESPELSSAYGRMVFITDIPTGNRYVDSLDNVMEWLESGTYSICNPINESDDFDWIRDINYYKYSIGDTIEPVTGYHYYVNTIDYVKKGPISGHQEATVMNILGDFYEVKFNYNYLSKEIRKHEISYYLLIDEVDK